MEAIYQGIQHKLLLREKNTYSVCVFIFFTCGRQNGIWPMLVIGERFFKHAKHKIFRAFRPQNAHFPGSSKQFNLFSSIHDAPHHRHIFATSKWSKKNSSLKRRLHSPGPSCRLLHILSPPPRKVFYFFFLHQNNNLMFITIKVTPPPTKKMSTGTLLPAVGRK